MAVKYTDMSLTPASGKTGVSPLAAPLWAHHVEITHQTERTFCDTFQQIPLLLHSDPEFLIPSVLWFMTTSVPPS
jgi:hypothetical protein